MRKDVEREMLDGRIDESLPLVLAGRLQHDRKCSMAIRDCTLGRDPIAANCPVRLEPAAEAAAVASDVERDLVPMLDHRHVLTRDLGAQPVARALDQELPANFGNPPFLRVPETTEIDERLALGWNGSLRAGCYRSQQQGANRQPSETHDRSPR